MSWTLEFIGRDREVCPPVIVHGGNENKSCSRSEESMTPSDRPHLERGPFFFFYEREGGGERSDKRKRSCFARGQTSSPDGGGGGW